MLFDGFEYVEDVCTHWLFSYNEGTVLISKHGDIESLMDHSPLKFELTITAQKEIGII